MNSQFGGDLEQSLPLMRPKTRSFENVVITIHYPRNQCDDSTFKLILSVVR
jgi:hypothetical protein